MLWTSSPGSTATVRQALLESFQLTLIDEIDSWPPVENGAAMPKPNLCSYCYKAKLEVMRMSPYSVYDAGTWKPRYDEVLKSKSHQTDKSFANL